MKMKLRTAVLLLLTTIAISACTQSTTVGINNVDAQSFLAKITDSSVTVIDVRSAEEYAEGHLANSININVESDQFNTQIANLDKEKEYALYCRSGRRSTLAAEQMASSGFTGITNYNQGGFTELAQLGAATN
jgi:rhodanese-related sulfurtransferase